MKVIKIQPGVKSILDEIRAEQGFKNYSDTLMFLREQYQMNRINKVTEVTPEVTTGNPEPEVALQPVAEIKNVKLTPDGKEVVAFTQLGTPVTREPREPADVNKLSKTLDDIKKHMKRFG